MTNATEDGREALRSKANQLGYELADLAGEKADLEQLQRGSLTSAAGAAAVKASAPPTAASPPQRKRPASVAGAKVEATADEKGKGRAKGCDTDAASHVNMKAGESGDEDTARPHGVEAAAAVPSSAVPEVIDIDTDTECSLDQGAGGGERVANTTAEVPAVVQEMITIDCSDHEEEGNENGKDDDNGDADRANGDDEGDEFVSCLLPTPSLRPELEAEAVEDVSFAFLAFAVPKGPALARTTRRGSKIKRIQERRANPLAKCLMTEYWQCAHSLALAAAVQFGGTPEQKKLTKALLTDLCTEGQELDTDTFSRLEGRLAGTAREDDDTDSEAEDGVRGVLVDPDKLVEVCNSEAILKEYMFGAVSVGVPEEQEGQKRILGDMGVKANRDRLKGDFRMLMKHCEVRCEYREHECYLDSLGSDTEGSDTERSVKNGAVKKGAGDKQSRPKERRYRTKAREKDVLRMAATPSSVRWRMAAIDEGKLPWCIPLQRDSSVDDLRRAVEIRENMLRQEAGKTEFVVGCKGCCLARDDTVRGYCPDRDVILQRS
eukprot:g13133.t1